MYAVTCQVSAYRETFGRAAADSREVAAGTVRYFRCGSHATAAASAGSAHTDRDSGTDPPEAL